MSAAAGPVGRTARFFLLRSVSPSLSCTTMRISTRLSMLRKSAPSGSKRKSGKAWWGAGYPVLRFVYPQQDGDWWELIAFAPPRMDNANDWIQAVWYRVSRVAQLSSPEIAR